MTPILTVVLQLVLLALGAIFAVLAASSARRAASFDVTRDFDALAQIVMKLQNTARSAQMKAVRAAALEPQQAQPVSHHQTKLSHAELRALMRSRNGGTTQ